MNSTEGENIMFLSSTILEGPVEVRLLVTLHCILSFIYQLTSACLSLYITAIAFVYIAQQNLFTQRSCNGK